MTAKPYERQFVLSEFNERFCRWQLISFYCNSFEESLREIGFTEEMETTWDNKKVLQTFSTILFIRKKI